MHLFISFGLVARPHGAQGFHLALHLGTLLVELRDPYGMPGIELWSAAKQNKSTLFTHYAIIEAPRFAS